MGGALWLRMMLSGLTEFRALALYYLWHVCAIPSEECSAQTAASLATLAVL
jgi:hypothetical protein